MNKSYLPLILECMTFALWCDGDGSTDNWGIGDLLRLIKFIKKLNKFFFSMSPYKKYVANITEP